MPERTGPAESTGDPGPHPGAAPAAEPVRPGTLYVVATPIGNLRDITLRAVDVLRGAHVIAAEDTRRTRILCQAYGIATPLVSYHAHNAARRAPELCARLAAGAVVALVSDAGTPGLSDPGAELVALAAREGHLVVAVPGPSAAVAALAGSGVSADAVVFWGFVPRRPGERDAFWRAVAADPRAHVAFEAPHRLRSSLRSLAAAAPDRPVVLARELTKVHEEFVRGTAAAVLAAVEEKFGSGRVAGECTLVVAGREAGAGGPAGAGPDAGAGTEGRLPAAGGGPDGAAVAVEALVREGHSLPEAVKQVARTAGLSRQAVYRAVVARREPGPPS